MFVWWPASRSASLQLSSGFGGAVAGRTTRDRFVLLDSDGGLDLTTLLLWLLPFR